MVNTQALEGCKDCVLSFGEKVITAKNCMVDSVNISTSESDVENVPYFGGRIENHKNLGLINITIELKCTQEGLSYFFNEEVKIKGKKIEDCSIRELLFAVRKKSKGK